MAVKSERSKVLLDEGEDGASIVSRGVYNEEVEVACRLRCGEQQTAMLRFSCIMLR